MIPTFCFLRRRRINNAQSHSPPSQTNPENCHVQVRATWQSERRRRFLFLPHLWTAEARIKNGSPLLFPHQTDNMSGLPGDFRRCKKRFSPETPGRADPPEKAKFGRDDRKVFFMFCGKCRNSRSELCSLVSLACVCVYVCNLSPVITCKETLASVVCPVE